MGCPCSHEEEPLIQNKHHQDFVKPPTSNMSLAKQAELRQSYRLPSADSSAKDINVVYTDFIGKGTGNMKDNYNLLGPPVGEGAFGEVRKCSHKKTGVERAVKIISKKSMNREAQEKLVKEVEILKRLDHPNIMKIHEFYEDKTHFYIISDFYDGGELFDKIVQLKLFTEKYAASTIRQILSAVAYCHQNKIVHRDLKPENVLYESKKAGAQIRIIDFGTSDLYDPKIIMKERLGTPYYIAPEVLEGQYSEKCDLWSVGVILYVLLCGYPPFDGNNEKEIFQAVLSGRFSFDEPEWKSVSDEAKSLITKLLERDPKKRLSAEQALWDPWFLVVLEKPDLDKPLAVSVLDNLKTFKSGHKFQSAAWMFLVNHLASNEDKAQLLKTFKALDTNGDGTLSREELIEGYKNILNSENPEAEVDAIMAAVDNNNSGVIDYTEFVIATISRKNMLKKEKIEKAFAYFDKDGDGFLTAEEIAEVLSPGQKDRDLEAWKEFIAEFDTSGDGQISMQEFKEMLNKLL